MEAFAHVFCVCCYLPPPLYHHHSNDDIIMAFRVMSDLSQCLLGRSALMNEYTDTYFTPSPASLPLCVRREKENQLKSTQVFQ